MEKITINHVISIGSCCHTATFLKQNDLKLCSFPFDWVFSGAHVVHDILIDNFNKFLDRELYTKFTDTRCGHKIYGYRFFNHKFPLGDKDHEYYKRCVKRFNYVLDFKDEPKLFIMSNISHERYPNFNYDNDRDYIIKIKEYLDNRTSNYYILYIDPIIVSDEEDHKEEVEIIDNIFFIKLFVKKCSDGVRFLHPPDNEKYKKCILDYFNFDITKI
mgnify:CR=1 FL=1